MAQFISFQPSDYYNTTVYTGNGTAIGSGGLPVTGVGFQADFTWIKNREQADNHILTDAVRGATKYVNSDRTNAEATNAESLTTWGADGFTLGNHAAVNTSAEDYVSWNWKGGTTSGITTDGSTTITPSAYSFSQTAGISIINYTGNSTSGAKVAHGLGVAPELIFCKDTVAANHWPVYHVDSGNGKYFVLSDTAAADTNTNRWNDTTPDSVNFTVGNSAAANSTNLYVAWCFASKPGFSHIGSYTGNGNADGAFIHCGFRPAVVIYKKDAVQDWCINDDKRLGYNPNNAYLFPNTTQTESDIERIDFYSNGFKLRTTDSGQNGDGDSYIYMAFAEFPFVSSNSKPGVAR